MASVAKGMFGGELPWDMIAHRRRRSARSSSRSTRWLKSRGSKFRVPVLAAAIGIYLPLELMVPIFLGGLLSYFVERKHRRRSSDEERRRTASIAPARCSPPA